MNSRYSERWIYDDIFQRFSDRNLPENVEVLTHMRFNVDLQWSDVCRYMESKDPSVFVSTYKEGVERVLGGNFAFLCESSMLDWLVQRDCNLTQIGGLVDNKGYGIATPKGSKWRDKISQAILLLQEKSSIQVKTKKHQVKW